MVDVSMLSALYAFPGASLFFFTALGIAAIGVEISTPHIKYSIFRGRCQASLARDAIRQEGIRLRRELYRGATRLAALLEIQEDQRREVESVDLKRSSGEGSTTARGNLPDFESKGGNVEHARKISQFDVEGWLLVASAEHVAFTMGSVEDDGKGNSDAGNRKTEKDTEKIRRASL
ncbi:hypothetical protein K443DRAFT_673742 [Laccaria amethystina LaAM-08-1]|uniref:Uncharacterized protein n=1 Tax=Laccaria amethystina LaAM-08-1 TaxID=1095629 RepID=A0A0C9YGL9_9AGAR|nr:hypothetical protein K443DRAFT_673742 [Laccaria amethystina LaAM-08-1]